MEMGDVVELRPYEGKALKNGKVIAEFKVKSDVLFDEVRAGGRIPLIIGRGLTAKAREALGLPASTLFRLPQRPADTRQGLHAGAEDGRPRLRPARRPGRAPRHLLRAEDDHRSARQDTTGPMTRDELKDLACLGFSRRPGDAVLLPHRGLPEAGGRQDAPRAARASSPPAAASRCARATASSTPGSTACCCPTPSAPAATATRASRSAFRFPAGSGLVAFAAATGVMPLDMPESVLVRFKGKMQPGITLRDLVNAIPLLRDQAGPADGRRRRARRTSSPAASSRSKACPTSRSSRPSS